MPIAEDLGPHVMTEDVAPTIGMPVLRAIVGAVEKAGVLRATFLQAIGRSEADLNAYDRRLAFREVIETCERALALSHDPALGLHWVEQLTVEPFGPVSHLLAHTGSLRGGFALLTKFLPLFCDQNAFTLVEHASTVSIHMTPWKFHSREMERFASEGLFAGILKVIRLYALEATPKLARFKFAAPAHRAEYERLFGAAVRFDQSETELVFERALLDCPSPHVDQDIRAALTSVAEQRLARLTHSAPLSLRVREYLLMLLPKRATLASAARALSANPRSLRRRLAVEGTSYREIEQGVLKVAAGRLLCEQGLTIQETAHALEFADAATFHRAFKGWTGLTPSEFRERALAQKSEQKDAANEN